MSKIFIPKEIVNYITNFVSDLKNVESNQVYFKEYIDQPLKVEAIKIKYYSYGMKYDTSRENEFYNEFYDDVYNDYEDKFIQRYYSELEDDFNILISCKCCLRHQTNRPVHIVNTPLDTYKKRYDRNREFITDSESSDFNDTSQELDLDEDPYICDCSCRFLARNFVRINKTTRKLYEENIRTMLFYEASKRVNYNRMSDIEHYKEHCSAFPEITIEEEEKNNLFDEFN